MSLGCDREGEKELEEQLFQNFYQLHLSSYKTRESSVPTWVQHDTACFSHLLGGNEQLLQNYENEENKRKEKNKCDVDECEVLVIPDWKRKHSINAISDSVVFNEKTLEEFTKSTNCLEYLNHSPQPIKNSENTRRSYLNTLPDWLRKESVGNKVTNREQASKTRHHSITCYFAPEYKGGEKLKTDAFYVDDVLEGGRDAEVEDIGFKDEEIGLDDGRSSEEDEMISLKAGEFCEEAGEIGLKAGEFCEEAGVIGLKACEFCEEAREIGLKAGEFCEDAEEIELNAGEITLNSGEYGDSVLLDYNPYCSNISSDIIAYVAYETSTDVDSPASQPYLQSKNTCRKSEPGTSRGKCQENRTRSQNQSCSVTKEDKCSNKTDGTNRVMDEFISSPLEKFNDMINFMMTPAALDLEDITNRPCEESYETDKNMDNFTDYIREKHIKQCLQLSDKALELTINRHANLIKQINDQKIARYAGKLQDCTISGVAEGNIKELEEQDDTIQVIGYIGTTG